MAHSLVELLAPLHGGRLLKLKHLLAEKVLQELVLIAYFEELVAAALVIVKDELELRNTFLALLAHPVVHLLVRTVNTIAIWQLVGLENLCRTAEPLEQVRFVFCWSIEQRQGLWQEVASIV